MITQSLATMGRTEPWTSSNVNIPGLESRLWLRTMSGHAQPVPSPKHCHHPYGLLKQLPILEKPWNSISMDFIEQLPSSSGFTAILVIVDWLSK